MTEQTTANYAVPGPRAKVWVDQPRQRHGPVIAAARAAVPVIDLADMLCGPGKMRRVGDEWVGRCPLPDHEDRVPSFSVNPDKNLWYCHGCVRGGDVVRLAQHVWDIGRADVAAAEVLLKFGHEVPQRPASWYRRQERQKPARDRIEAAKLAHIQRRVFRVFRSLLDDLEDEELKRKEAELLWDASEEIARCVWAGRSRA